MESKSKLFNRRMIEYRQKFRDIYGKDFVTEWKIIREWLRYEYRNGYRNCFEAKK